MERLAERRPASGAPSARTGLAVTPLCVGCAPLGDMPETFAYSVAEEHALATLRAAFAGPITFIDTAASYGDGESERRIGLVLRELGGLPPGTSWPPRPTATSAAGTSAETQMRRSVERSLRLLGARPPAGLLPARPGAHHLRGGDRPGGGWWRPC